MTDISQYCAACECAVPNECGCTHTCGIDNDAARDAAGEQPSDPRYETYMQKNSNRIPVLDHGYIELLDHMGSDIEIVNAARTSFDAVSEMHFDPCPMSPHSDNLPLPEHQRWGSCCCGVIRDARMGRYPFDGDAVEEWSGARESLSKQDAGLINFLMRERHGTPFEMVEFKFAVKAPIFVFREWHRHRIASINEMSGRYVELEREFYVPAREDIRVQNGKPGAYFYEAMDDDAAAEKVAEAIRFSSNSAFDEYEAMLADGVAKEIARLVLPVNTYSKMVWKTNLRALMNFLSLRNHEHAQREIRYYAEAMEQIVSTIAPVAMEAFIEYGRKTP